jgi:hypothetical protein
VPSGFVPQLEDEVAEAVHHTEGVREARCAVDVADGAHPAGDAVEVAERLLEGGEHRERAKAGGLVSLVDGQRLTDLALHQIGGAVCRPMSGGVCLAARDPHEHEGELGPRRRRHRRGQPQAELAEPLLDRAHSLSANENTSLSACGS